MRVIILAGGLGTRLAEETEVTPKPMVEIGDRPILWHIMKHYSYYGVKEFFVALGYKGDFIKRYLAARAVVELRRLWQLVGGNLLGLLQRTFKLHLR